MYRSARALVLGALLLPPVALYAEERPETIIVTATRTAQTADETLAAVTVLTRADIERRQARSLDDLLRDEAGISFSNSGGPGKATSLFVRGTNADHVLVLIDGIKVGSATLGEAPIQDIPVEQIERIEIVRGPRSSLYGSEAIGGVIQIFTRRGGGALTPAGSIGGGSHRSYNASTGVSGGGDHAWFNVYASGVGTQGINSCRGSLTTGAGCGTDEPDNDGYWNNSGSARAGYRFANGTEIDLFWLRAQGRNEFDAPDAFDPVTFQAFELGPNETRFLQETMGSTLKFSPLQNWRATLIAGRNRDDSKNFNAGGVFDSRFDTQRDTISFQNDFALSTRQLLTLGLDYQEDRVSSTANFAVTSRQNRAVFGLYQAKLDRHSFEASLREDDNEQFGTHDTGAIAWGYRMTEKLRAFASYGTAFKAPTFNDLYFPGFGNPNLLPETSRSIEAGLGGSSASARWSVNAFQTDIDDLISFDASSLAPINVDVARIRGLETTLATRAAGWDVNAAATLLDPRNRGSAFDDKLLPRRARELLRLDLSRAVGPFRYGTVVRAEGPRFNDQANTQRLGGFATVDLIGEHAFAKNWLGQVRVGNLFDKQYETAQFFNQPGREFFFTVRYQPPIVQ
ncbi:MAG: TonB-dependent vitamin B12 receptor [Sulfurifustis sp.]